MDLLHWCTVTEYADEHSDSLINSILLTVGDAQRNPMIGQFKHKAKKPLNNLTLILGVGRLHHDIFINAKSAISCPRLSHLKV